MNTGLTLPRFARNKADNQTQPKDIPETIKLPLRSPTIQLPIRSPTLQLPIRSPTLQLPIRSPTLQLPIRSPTLQLPRMTGVQSPRTPTIRVPRMTGVQSPNSSNYLKVEENPWLPIKVDGAGEIKIAAITPIGTVAMVPTCDKRPVPTPRRQQATPTRSLKLRVVDEQNGEIKIDPILTTAIYLDCTKPEDQDYNHVAEHMRLIAETTNALNNQYTTALRPLIFMAGRVSSTNFETALSVYENNQVYYQDRIDDKGITIDAIKQGLIELEIWFAFIIEPKPMDVNDVDAWKDRESMKIRKGVTAYCDPELYCYLRPFDAKTKENIWKFQTN